MVGGAAAFVVIAKFADVAPAGMTTVDGTDATVESLLNNNAVVGAGSGKASDTVPTEGAPSRTVSGETDSAEMMPSACETLGRTSANAVAEIATSQEVRRMTAPWTGSGPPLITERRATWPLSPSKGAPKPSHCCFARRRSPVRSAYPGPGRDAAPLGHR